MKSCCNSLEWQATAILDSMMCFSAEPFSIDHVDVYGGGVDGGGEGDEDDGDYDLSQCSSSRCREYLLWQKLLLEADFRTQLQRAL